MEGGYTPKDPELVRRITGLSLFDINDYFQNDSSREGTVERCRKMIFQPQINYDGKLFGCCSNTKNLTSVNVFENGLIEAVNSMEYRRVVAGLLKGKDCDIDPCANCYWRPDRLL